jgi:undecaprenyl-diphosphatase
MELTSAALWLNSFFYGYDSAILSGLHSLATHLGTVLTPLMKLITLLGEKGLIFFLLALIFMCFADTRDLGVCIFGAVCCGALITNIILKDNVARPRPFETVEQFRQWWVYVGSPAEDSFSFPSGHVTAATAGMMAISLMKGKKWATPSVIIVVLMGISRNYLMAHYPSDVLAAMVIGCFSGFVAWLITKLIFGFLNEHGDIILFELILDFDLGDYLPFSLPFAHKAEADYDYDDGGEDEVSPAPAQVRKSASHEKASSAKTSSAKFSVPGTYKGKHEK